MRVDFVKKNISAEVEGSKKRQKKAVFWQIGKSLIVNQPVPLESWKKRWMCGFSPRLRKNIKNSESHSGKKNSFEKISNNPFFGSFRSNFFLFYHKKHIVAEKLYFHRVTIDDWSTALFSSCNVLFFNIWLLCWFWFLCIW